MTLKLNGSTAGSVSIDAPADTSPTGTDVTLTLPTSAGSSGQYLQTNGSGTLSWQTVEGLPDAIDVNASAPADSLVIDSSGRVGIGTTTPNKLTELRSTDAATTLRISNRYTSNSGAAVIDFETLYGGVDGAYGYAEIGAVRDGTATNYMYFKASGTERMRITNGGFIKASNSGSYPDGTNDNTGHYFNHNRTANPVLFIRADSGSYGETGEGALFVRVNRNTTNNSFNIAAFVNGNGTGKCLIRDNGDLENTNNSYTGISDVKLKENIVDANSQWDDIKALEFKSYNLIAKPDERHIGVIAQQVEQVSPGLVRDTKDFDADGNDLGTVTKSVKYSILYTKAVKALQEAMERIETLETANASQAATIAALDARLTALEGGAS